MANRESDQNVDLKDKVTKAVMAVYKNVNPSFVENLGTDEKRSKYISDWMNLIIRKLAVPPICFQGARVLDVGCGSGEKSLVYASLGAQVVGLDVNEKAIALAQSRAKEWGLESAAKFEVCSVFDIDRKDSFDIVVSDGMIHHTADPRLAFTKFANLVRPGGILLLGLNETAGFFQRKLQRYLVNKIAGDSTETKIAVARILFKDKLERASKASGRSVESTIHDSFINPQALTISVDEVEAWMSDYQINLDCTWPPTAIPLVADSQYHPELETGHKSVVSWRSIVRTIWLLKDQYDDEFFSTYFHSNDELRELLSSLPKICTDFELDTKSLQGFLGAFKKADVSCLPGFDLSQDLKSFVDEILRVEESISASKAKNMSPEDIARQLKFTRLFSGFHGVGMVYYRGTRNLS